MMNYLELDKHMSETYPKLFVGGVGTGCSPGWGNILKALCNNIQYHIDWARKSRANALQYNRCLKRALNGDKAGMIWYHTYENMTAPSHRIDEEIAEAKYRTVPDSVTQVTVVQVKEKFGTLRFYYSGGDEQIFGMVRMAESMSACTCEECGSPGIRRSGGWLRTLCDTHAKGQRQYNDESIEP